MPTAGFRNQVWLLRSLAARPSSTTGDADQRRRQALLDNVEDLDEPVATQQPTPGAPIQPPAPTPLDDAVDPRTQPPPIEDAASPPPQQPRTQTAAGWGADVGVDDGWGAAGEAEEPPSSPFWGGGANTGSRTSARAFARSVFGAFVGGSFDEPARGPKADVVPLTELEEVRDGTSTLPHPNHGHRSWCFLSCRSRTRHSTLRGTSRRSLNGLAPPLWSW